MHKKTLTIAFLALGASAAHAQFIGGDLAVVVLGDGTAAISSAAAQARLFDFNKTSTGQTGTSVVNLSTGPAGSRVTTSGSATSEGFLSRSTDGQYLSYQGYDAAAGTANVVTSNAARLHAAVDANGTVVNYTNMQAYTSNNLRSSFIDGSNFYSAGTSTSDGGVRQGVIGVSGSTLLSGSLTNTRVVGVDGGSVFATSSSGSFVGLNLISGGSASLKIATGSGSSPYGFFIKDSNTVYIADDRTSASGGIQKWTFSGSSWSLAYTLSTGTSNGARGLAGELDGSGNTVLYATTVEGSANRLVRITDLGAGSAVTTLATAGTNTIFRGVALNPTVVPEPGSMVALATGLAAVVARRRRK